MKYIKHILIIGMLLAASGCSRSFWHPDNRIRARHEVKDFKFDPNDPAHYLFLEHMYKNWQRQRRLEQQPETEKSKG